VLARETDVSSNFDLKISRYKIRDFQRSNRVKGIEEKPVEAKTSDIVHGGQDVGRRPALEG
jgi:hypothetical protein